jgi:hypothetical protein
MFGPEYFTVAAYMPADSGTILCRDCGDAAGLPASDQLVQAEFNNGWDDGCYCDGCGAEIVAPYEWTCPYCETEHTGEEASGLESKYYRDRSTFTCSDNCPGEEPDN